MHVPLTGGLKEAGVVGNDRIERIRAARRLGGRVRWGWVGCDGTRGSGQKR